jgi:hypothetical protein
VDAQHSCQAVLPDACCVHPQLQVRVYISIQCHSMLSSFNWLQLLRSCYAICLPNPEALVCQHIVAGGQL